MWDSRKICVVAVTVALCIGSNYALISVPNVKVMDFFVFIIGFVFGYLVGGSVGVFVWLVYGSLNPYGFVPQIWLATMFSEAIYGVAGGFIGKQATSTNFVSSSLGLSFSLGAAGFLLTFVYDLITNFVYAWTFDVPLPIALIAGVPFMLVHELSNAVLFGTCSIPLIIALEKFMGGERFWYR